MKNVEDVYPLSSMQQGMLFHALADPDSAPYVERISWSLRGQLNVEAFNAAWQLMVERHTALRTLFLYTGLDEPLQVVRRKVKLPWSQEDWQTLTAEEQEARFADLLESERRRGFKLGEAPLMRLQLIQLSPTHHRFLWSYHHLVLDGWSVALILQQVWEAYTALTSQGRPPRLQSRPYRDYIAWLGQQDLAKTELYWRETLKGFHAPTLIGTESALRPAPAPAEAYCNTQGLRLSAETTAALHALARQHQLTLNTIVQGAWALLLSRYSGEEDVVFGSVVSGRPASLPGADAMVGLFINTLPLRVRLDADEPVIDWLKRLQVEQVEMRQYEHSPLVQVQQWSEVGGGQSLFESIVVFENLPEDDSLGAAGGRTQVTNLVHHEMVTGYGLTVAVIPEAQMRVQFTYDKQRHHDETISRMMGHLKQSLEGIATNRWQHLSEIALLTKEEQQLLLEWNDTRRDYPQDICIHHLFESQAARSPDAPALSFNDETLTYQQLNARANQLAHHLISSGIRPEHSVGILLERSAELVIALLAVWKAGAAYVPLDPSHPAQRWSFILSDASPRLLISEQRFSEALQTQSAHLLLLDREADIISNASKENPAVDVAPEHLCYVIYTSGSTGEPKGVEVEHRHLVNTMSAVREHFRFTERDVVACLAPCSFDIFLFELLSPLLVGARSLLLHHRELLERAVAERVLSEVTFLHAVPGLMRQVVSFVEEAQAAGRYAQVRALFVGGDAVPPELIEQMHAAFPSAEVTVGYGPTEATIMCAAIVVERGTAVQHQLVGRAMGNSQLRLYDKHRNLVPMGVIGEIYIGGRSVTRGYLNREELTQQKYVEIEGERYYRSGDLGRYLGDGVIAFAGRADTQVKVRGYRIELGEIEAVLSTYEGIKESVVVVREERAGDQRLVAYVVAVEGASVESGELRRYLQERMPEYMVPSSFVKLDKMPLTELAKIDRKALPVPDEVRAELRQEYVAPRSAIEEVMASIWAELLQVERVGVYDNFFELGGHSLLATQLMSRVRDAFQVEVPLRGLFEQSTLAGFASRIEAALRAGQGLIAPPLVPIGREQVLPLSFAQQRLWFIDQLQPGTLLYNMPNSVRLTGRLNIAVLEETLGEIVRRHEAVRTRFLLLDGQPVQVIDPPLPFKLPLIDLSDVEAHDREEIAQQLASEEASRPFDLSQGPLLRAKLVRLSEQEHLVLFTMHHIISDGWSIGVLIREVAALYEAYTAGMPSPLSELPVQYADFAHWQRQWLTGEVLEQEVAYWRKQLAGAPAVLELPTDHPRPPVQTHRGAHQRFLIDDELTKSLKEMSRREGVTLFMTLLAAWQTLLSRYSGQEDISVGMPIANRNRGETEGLIGFFVNTLVLRGDLRGDPTVRKLLEQTREVCLGAYAHQDLPFEKLVEELQPERSLSHSPLFQVIFVLENVDMELRELPELKIAPLQQDSEKALFDLSLGMAETREGIIGNLSYNTDLFEAATIERLIEHYQTMLSAFAANPEQQLSTLPLLSAHEQQLIAEWNDTQRDYPQDICIHHLFEAQAARSPDVPALTFNDETLTYQQLNARANQLAHHLISSGIRPEHSVGILLERSAELVIALLAVWKAGAAYVPLDPSHPAQRWSFILSDAAPRLLISEQRLAESLPQPSAPLLLLDNEADVISDLSAENPAVDVAPEHLCYVIYTSGSTGEPKGVEVEHRHLVNTMSAVREHFRFTERDVVPCLAPFSFDIFLFELLTPLLAGGQSMLLGHRELLERTAMSRVLDEVTFLHATPGLMRQVVNFVEEEQAAGRYAQVRALFVGGDAVPPELVQQMHANFPSAEVTVGYGPTEATVMCAAIVVERGTAVQHQLVGRAMGNSQLRLYDKYQNLVPIGVTGELYIGGRSVTRGYLNREELTQQKYVEIEGERYYRSGDLGRYLRDGVIAFAGRADTQVKVRGYRIELGEIEAVLSAREGIKESVVVVREERAGDQRLVAYVVAAEGATVESGELRRYLQERMPEYMVPGSYVQMEALPLTELGKVDRKALPVPDEVGGEPEHAYIAPRTVVEEMLASMWGELLQVERVGVYDNFFELGGHSLLATQLMSRVRDAFQVEIPLHNLFEAATVAKLSEQVEQSLKAGEGIIAPPIVPVSRDGALPLSFAQQRLWFIDQLQPGSALYNSAEAVRLSGRLMVGALEETLSEIVRRHEALRTRFEVVDGEPRQVIDAPRPVQLKIIDLSHEQEESERERRADELARAEARQPFDLSRGPLLRASLLRLAEEEHIALFTIHHIVSDGWSIGVLIREVAALYEAYTAGMPSPLAELPIQYADFAHWQRQWLTGEVLEQEVAYWRKQLAGAPAVLELPTDHPRPPVQTHRGAHQRFLIDDELTKSLKEMSQREGVTLFMTLLAGLQVLLSRYSRQEDIVVGTTIANRNRGETEGLIGFFVNTLVLRGDLRGDPTVRELLQRDREVCLGAYAHQDLPFEKLVEELQPERSLSHSPLFQVMFGLENVPMGELELPGLKLNVMGEKDETTKFDLSFAMQETGDAVGVLLGYNTDLFEAATISRMRGHLEMLLRSMVEQPDARVSMLRMLTEEEEQEQELRRREREQSEIEQLRGIRRKRASSSRVTAAKTEPQLAEEVTLASNQS